MLEGRKLGFRYPGQPEWLFSGIEITVLPGQRLGLPGPSGCGKSTLAKILAGYISPSCGQVRFPQPAERPPFFHPVQLIFQHPEQAVNPRWTIKEILREASEPSPEILARLEIDTSWLNRYPHELSGGELQRVCLARALDRRVRYVICDEMTSMLDALTQAHIWKVMLELTAERNIGMLVISHDSALLSKICEGTLSWFTTGGIFPSSPPATEKDSVLL